MTKQQSVDMIELFMIPKSQKVTPSFFNTFRFQKDF